MNSFSIAYSSFKNNLKTYSMHILSMVFSIAVFYNFLSIKYYPAFTDANSSYLAGTANATAVVLFIFLVFYIWYSTSFFLKQRKKEIGIYAFMGISNKQIAYIFAIETMFIGFLSIIIGLATGILFGKLFMMFLAKIALLSIQIKFFISIESLIQTAIFFLIIFILITLIGYIEISRSKLIDLFNANKKEEKLPKVNYLKAILSIIIIGSGYYVGINSLQLNFIIAFPVTVLLVSWGTYWLFGSFISLIIKFLLDKKNILYKGINIVSIPNIAYRIRENYRVLATIAILITTTIAAFGTSVSMKYYVNETYSISNPYTFSYLSESNDVELDKQISTIITESKHDIILNEEIELLYIDSNIESDTEYPITSIGAVKYSDFVRTTEELNVDGADKILNGLENGESIYIPVPTTYLSLVDEEGSKLLINGLNINIIERVKTPLFGNGVPSSILVLNDEDYALLQDNYEKYSFNGIILSDPDNAKGLVESISKFNLDDVALYSYLLSKKEELVGIVYFFGAFLSLVLVIGTGSIIYFKILSDAFRDKDKFNILSKVGMTKKEISKIVSRQVGISFLLPLLIGTIHSSVAIYVLSKMMQFNLLVPAITSIMIYSIIYGLYYLLTTRKFLKIIYED